MPDMNTTSANKRIAKNTMLLYFRMFIIMGVSLFTSRVILRTLGVDDYGIYNVVSGFVSMFSFINSAMTSATQRYITYAIGEGDCNQINKVFCTSLNIHFLISAIIVFAAETFGLWFLNNHMTIPEGRMVAANVVFQLAVFSTVVLIISTPYNALIIAHERMSAFAYISIVDVAVRLFVVYLLYLSNFDKLVAYAFLLFLVQLLMRQLYTVYCRKHFKESNYFFYKDKNLFKEMVSFSMWNLFGNLASVASGQGVNVVLNMFFGPAVNAARGISVQVQHAVNAFSSNFQMALNPQITKNYASGNLSQMHALVYASSKYSFYLLLIISLPIFLEVDTILSLWLGIVPPHTSNFLRIVLFITIINAMASPMTISAQANGHIKLYQSLVGGILLMTLPASYFALKIHLVPEVVYVVELVIVIVAQIVRCYMMRKMISFSISHYCRKVLLRVLVVGVSGSIIPVYLYKVLPDSISSFFVICIASVVCVCISSFCFGLNNYERTKVCEIVSRQLQMRK